jgi:hypothetical protein
MERGLERQRVFTVASVRNGKISWRYETYGFKSVAPDNT